MTAGGGEAIWISGASSGIGAALVDSAPGASRVIGISRRPSRAPEHIAADLADPAGWDAVRASFEEVVGGGLERAVFLHFSGVGTPHGPAAEADPEQYQRAILLNYAAGLALGQSFLHTTRRHGTRSALVLCSSPAALEPLFGMSHYNPSKLGYDRWAECVRLELDPEQAVVFTVVPFSVDTPMLRKVMDLPAEIDPLSVELRRQAEAGELASPESVAAEVWELLAAGGKEARAFVGAVPPELR